MHINMINYYRKTFGAFDIQSGVLTKMCGTGAILGSPCFCMSSTSHTNTKIGHISQVPFLNPNSGMTIANKNPRLYQNNDKKFKKVGNTAIFNDRCKCLLNDCDLLDFVVNVEKELKEYRTVSFSFGCLDDAKLKRLLIEIEEVTKLIMAEHTIIESYFTGTIQDISSHPIMTVSFFRLEDIIPIWTKKPVGGFGMELFLRPSSARGVMFIMPSVSKGVTHIDGENIYKYRGGDNNWEIRDMRSESLILKSYMMNMRPYATEEREEKIIEKINKGE